MAILALTTVTIKNDKTARLQRSCKWQDQFVLIAGNSVKTQEVEMVSGLSLGFEPELYLRSPSCVTAQAFVKRA